MAKSNNGLIELKKEETGFFTSIYVYPNNMVIPTEDVWKIRSKEEDDNIISSNVIFFKDIKTNELLKFSIDKDSEILTENIKFDNTFLINQMRDFIRINFDTFLEYYKGFFDLDDLIQFLKKQQPPIPKSYKFLVDNFYKNEESYEYEKYIIKYATPSQKIKANSEVFNSLFCKCLLWKNNKQAIGYWSDMLVSGLIKALELVAKDGDINLLDLFFKKYTESSLSCMCNSIVTKICDDNYLAFKYLGRPIDVDYKLAKQKYDNFCDNLHQWYKNKKDSLLEYNYDVFSDLKNELKSIIEILI